MEEALAPQFRPPSDGTGRPDPALLKRLRSAALFTTIAGAAYAVLFITSFWLMLDVPTTEDSAKQVADYYESTDGQVVNLVALYLLPFAGISFLWFVVSVRMWISARAVRPINNLFSNVQFSSGLIFLTLLFASAAAMSVGPITFNASDDLPTPVVIRDFPLFGSSLFFVFATRMGAMFVFTTTRICSSAGIIPRWFTIHGLLVGITMLLTASFNRWLIVVFPLWVLVLCLLTQLHVRSLVKEYRAQQTDQESPIQGEPAT